MKRIVLCILAFAMLLALVGCSSPVEKAQELVREGEYKEAIQLLQEEDSEEAKALHYTYSLEYAGELASKGGYERALKALEAVDQTEEVKLLVQEYSAKYVEELLSRGEAAEAKTYLEGLDEEYDTKALMAKCNVYLLTEIVNQKGVPGSHGMQLYKVVSDHETVYIETSEDGRIIFGQETETPVGSCRLDLYIDGTATPYFEGTLTLSFALGENEIVYTTTGRGTVDISAVGMPVTLDSYHSSGSVSSVGSITEELLSEESFKESMGTWLKTIYLYIPRVLSENDCGMLLQDFGFR